MGIDNRRPIAARDTGWAQKITRSLIKLRLTPNAISIWSIVFSLIGAACIGLTHGAAWSWFAFALCIQLRLLCNLFDGMVAVDGGMSSAVGALYNEVPDRVSDTVFFLSAAYVIDLPELGWAAALFAAFTAYIRVLGGSVGEPQLFLGPFAKQQRMAVLTGAALVSIIEAAWLHSFYVMAVALGIIALGSAYTCVRRLRAIANQLYTKANQADQDAHYPFK